jgi:LmbE family N-acetylglucosaminyl deacetylase
MCFAPLTPPFLLPRTSDNIFQQANVVDKHGSKTVAVIVAHPDDETLWVGGTILSHPSWNWHIAVLCRASDGDRAPKFFQAQQILGATGKMGDLDDDPEQRPLDENDVQRMIQTLLPQQHFDLIISHDPTGEYTRHIRHEETSRAVITLWQAGQLSTDELWTFAYEDGGNHYLPRPIKMAPIYNVLPEQTWRKKYRIITKTYGFGQDSFEAQTTPQAESFWQFFSAAAAQDWLHHGGGPP